MNLSNRTYTVGDRVVLLGQSESDGGWLTDPPYFEGLPYCLIEGYVTSVLSPFHARANQSLITTAQLTIMTTRDGNPVPLTRFANVDTLREILGRIHRNTLDTDEPKREFLRAFALPMVITGVPYARMLRDIGAMMGRADAAIELADMQQLSLAAAQHGVPVIPFETPAPLITSSFESQLVEKLREWENTGWPTDPYAGDEEPEDF